MKKLLILFPFFYLSFHTITAQNLYFPPVAGNTWATTPPQNLGFCPAQIDSLYQFLDDNNTKSFILLKDGKIVLERYFGSFTQDSLHYWASAGKSLTAFLVGMAMDEGIVHLSDKTSQHLGIGWTSMPQAKEDLITLRHQITMTTGLDDGGSDDNCMTPSCLTYLTDAGTRWAYHNAPYRLVQNVVAAASGQSFQQFTKTRLFNKVGMSGFWFNYIMYGRARDMARFGLLMHAKGVWNGDTILHNTNYYQDMIVPSQSYNNSYGYLWWLNGQDNFMLPGVQFVFPGKLCVNAPDDMYAALGKDDQKIHVVPSKGWVVVRQGENANSNSPVPIEFDNQLWAYLNQLDCGASSVTTTQSPNSVALQAYPTVSNSGWNIVASEPIISIHLFNAYGQQIRAKSLDNAQSTFHFSGYVLPAGTYKVVVFTEKGSTASTTIVKQ